MKILIDYYIGEKGKRQIMHTIIEESDIMEILEKKFRDGDLACPIYYDREIVPVEFTIDEVRV
jgi:hypothetical protein